MEDWNKKIKRIKFDSIIAKMIHNFRCLLKYHINDMCNEAEKKEIYKWFSKWFSKCINKCIRTKFKTRFLDDRNNECPAIF